MTDTPQPVQLQTKPKTLALIVGGGLLAGTLIVLGAILPAEYNVDPLGLGKLTGVGRLWAPESKSFEGGSAALSYNSETPKQSHTVEINLGAAGWDEAALEYKVHMIPGQSILYKWSATKIDGTPLSTPIEYDQHGHDVVAEGEEETVVQFRQARALSDQGSLAAPMDGIFGWYFRNHDENPIVIRLEIEGFYTLIPPRQPGNEFGILPVEPAAPPT
jgi:hypothetical protein